MATETGTGVQAEFEDAVNMTAAELEKWLETGESKKVGQRSGGGESVAQRPGGPTIRRRSPPRR
jgi:hypothetical protein